MLKSQSQKIEDDKDAWSMGKNLVNLTNLKQGMTLESDLAAIKGDASSHGKTS
jgi:hypothetical protein